MSRLLPVVLSLLLLTPLAPDRPEPGVVEEPAGALSLTSGWLLGRGGGTVASVGPDGATDPVWRSPLPGRPRVVNPFDPPARRWLPGHRGVDLLGATTSPVTAVADGVVSYSGEIDGVGIVTVRHGPDLRSTYQPVAGRIGTGRSVAAGDLLGLLEEGGHCLLVSCLHLGAVRGRDRYVDPMLYLTAWELTLLPLRDEQPAPPRRAGP